MYLIMNKMINISVTKFISVNHILPEIFLIHDIVTSLTSAKVM